MDRILYIKALIIYLFSICEIWSSMLLIGIFSRDADWMAKCQLNLIQSTLHVVLVLPPATKAWYQTFTYIRRLFGCLFSPSPSCVDSTARLPLKHVNCTIRMHYTDDVKYGNKSVRTLTIPTQNLIEIFQICNYNNCSNSLSRSPRTIKCSKSCDSCVHLKIVIVRYLFSRTRQKKWVLIWKRYCSEKYCTTISLVFCLLFGYISCVRVSARAYILLFLVLRCSHLMFLLFRLLGFGLATFWPTSQCVALFRNLRVKISVDRNSLIESIIVYHTLF